MPDPAALTLLLEEVRRRLDSPHNDFAWSSWDDRGEALDEVDGYLAALRRGAIPDLGILFVPTGPLQEVAESSGWGPAFLDLAQRYQEAMH